MKLNLLPESQDKNSLTFSQSGSHILREASQNNEEELYKNCPFFWCLAE